MEPDPSHNSPLTATLSPAQRREHARRIWEAGVAAVQPAQCVPAALRQLEGFPPLSSFDRILVVGGGKAGAAMSQALEDTLERLGIDLDRVQGWVNVPKETVVPLRSIHLHPARPMGINHPTLEAVQGTQEILRLVDSAGPNDLLLCLISGGGSALLCAPVPGVSLAEKQAVTKLLHQCGASIAEMNTVRKHLSLIKGGGLVSRFLRYSVGPQFFRFHLGGVGQRRLLSLIISDVIGDPLDVIASGPTCVDPTTFADALAVLERFALWEKVPESVRACLVLGAGQAMPETLKHAPTRDGKPVVLNRVIASNAHALEAAAKTARELGYTVTNLGDRMAGDTAAFAMQLLQQCQDPVTAPRCILSGGETTVTLVEGHGQGGRNQELALAYLAHADNRTMQRIMLLCGGTDGEDGPTDAAGAFADVEILQRAKQKGLAAQDHLNRHDSYPFFAATDGLFKTGLTNTNVMDLHVLLLYPSS